MEIQTKVLRDALELVAPAVPKKPTLEALRYARLGGGRAVATDCATLARP